MSDKQFFRDNCPDDVPFFSRPLWLDFISQNNWNVAMVKDGTNIKAVMTYVVDNRDKPTKIIMPPLTKFMGPFLKIDKNKINSNITEENRLLDELERQLPKVKYFRQAWHPQYFNCLPFLWKKYIAKVKYCYVLGKGNSVDATWAGLNEDTRRLVRKAVSSEVNVVRKNDPDTFIEIIKKIYSKQKLALPYSKDFVCRLSNFLDENKCGTMAFAIGENSEHYACALILHDKNTDYLLAGGALPAARNTGANALLIWTMIEASVKSNKEFNFLGSTLKSKESFIRSFGGQIYPYLDILKDDTFLARVKSWIKKCKV